MKDKAPPSTNLTKKKEKKLPRYRLENMEHFLNSGAPNAATKARLAAQMLVYFMNKKKSIYINEFYLSKGIRRNQYYEWVGSSKPLKKAHNYCLEVLGLRRSKVMAKHNPLILKHQQYQYDEGWNEADKRALQKDIPEERVVKVEFKDFKND